MEYAEFKARVARAEALVPPLPDEIEMRHNYMLRVAKLYLAERQTSSPLDVALEDLRGETRDWLDAYLGRETPTVDAERTLTEAAEMWQWAQMLDAVNAAKIREMKPSQITYATLVALSYAIEDYTPLEFLRRWPKAGQLAPDDAANSGDVLSAVFADLWAGVSVDDVLAPALRGALAYVGVPDPSTGLPLKRDEGAAWKRRTPDDLKFNRLYREWRKAMSAVYVAIPKFAQEPAFRYTERVARVVYMLEGGSDEDANFDVVVADARRAGRAVLAFAATETLPRDMLLEWGYGALTNVYKFVVGFEAARLARKFHLAGRSLNVFVGSMLVVAFDLDDEVLAWFPTRWRDEMRKMERGELKTYPFSDDHMAYVTTQLHDLLALSPYEEEDDDDPDEERRELLFLNANFRQSLAYRRLKDELGFE